MCPKCVKRLDPFLHKAANEENEENEENDSDEENELDEKVECIIISDEEIPATPKRGIKRSRYGFSFFDCSYGKC